MSFGYIYTVKTRWHDHPLDCNQLVVLGDLITFTFHKGIMY